MSKKALKTHAKTLSDEGSSKGGYARASKLTPKERTSIAIQGGKARWL